MKNIKWYIDNLDFEGAFERWSTTSPAWKNRWYDACEKIFVTGKKWLNEYIFNPVSRTISKINDIRSVFTRVKQSGISISEDCKPWNDSAGVQKCYLIEFFDPEMNLVCSKVGTTVRKVTERIREELTSKTYTGMGAVHCVINRVYECGNLPAEGVESMFRAKYIKMYPNSFHKNDRFINEHFDLKQADNFFKEYIN